MTRWAFPWQGTQSIPPGGGAGSWHWGRRLLGRGCCWCGWGYSVDGVDQGGCCFGVDGYAQHERVCGQVVADFEVESAVEVSLLLFGQQGDVDRGERQGFDEAEVGWCALLEFPGEFCE